MWPVKFFSRAETDFFTAFAEPSRVLLTSFMRDTFLLGGNNLFESRKKCFPLFLRKGRWSDTPHCGISISELRQHSSDE
jgi:hypothetical protein